MAELYATKNSGILSDAVVVVVFVIVVSLLLLLLWLSVYVCF